jgi:Type II/IV secretion system protein
MMGEIPDLDTADALLRVANTGHRVITMLHANSAAMVPIRSLQLGLPFLIAFRAVSNSPHGTTTFSVGLIQQVCVSNIDQIFLANSKVYHQLLDDSVTFRRRLILLEDKFKFDEFS